MAARKTSASIVSVAVVVLGVGWVTAADRSQDPADWLLAVLIGAISVIVAIGLWQRRRGSLAAYSGWALLALGFHVYRDMHVEPVTWKVGMGTLVVAVLLFVLGLAARFSQRGERPDGL